MNEKSSMINVLVNVRHENSRRHCGNMLTEQMIACEKPKLLCPMRMPRNMKLPLIYLPHIVYLNLVALKYEAALKYAVYTAVYLSLKVRNHEGFAEP